MRIARLTYMWYNRLKHDAHAQQGYIGVTDPRSCALEGISNIGLWLFNEPRKSATSKLASARRERAAYAQQKLEMLHALPAQVHNRL